MDDHVFTECVNWCVNRGHARLLTEMLQAEVKAHGDSAPPLHRYQRQGLLEDNSAALRALIGVGIPFGFDVRVDSVTAAHEVAKLLACADTPGQCRFELRFASFDEQTGRAVAALLAPALQTCAGLQCVSLRGPADGECVLDLAFLTAIITNHRVDVIALGSGLRWAGVERGVEAEVGEAIFSRNDARQEDTGLLRDLWRAMAKAVVLNNCGVQVVLGIGSTSSVLDSELQNSDDIASYKDIYDGGDYTPMFSLDPVTGNMLIVDQGQCTWAEKEDSGHKFWQVSGEYVRFLNLTHLMDATTLAENAELVAKLLVGDDAAIGSPLQRELAAALSNQYTDFSFQNAWHRIALDGNDPALVVAQVRFLTQISQPVSIVVGPLGMPLAIDLLAAGHDAVTRVELQAETQGACNRDAVSQLAHAIKAGGLVTSVALPLHNPADAERAAVLLGSLVDYSQLVEVYIHCSEQSAEIGAEDMKALTSTKLPHSLIRWTIRTSGDEAADPFARELLLALQAHACMKQLDLHCPVNRLEELNNWALCITQLTKLEYLKWGLKMPRIASADPDGDDVTIDYAASIPRDGASTFGDPIEIIMKVECGELWPSDHEEAHEKGVIPSAAWLTTLRSHPSLSKVDAVLVGEQTIAHHESGEDYGSGPLPVALPLNLPRNIRAHLHAIWVCRREEGWHQVMRGFGTAWGTDNNAVAPASVGAVFADNWQRFARHLEVQDALNLSRLNRWAASRGFLENHLSAVRVTSDARADEADFGWLAALLPKGIGRTELRWLACQLSRQAQAVLRRELQVVGDASGDMTLCSALTSDLTQFLEARGVAMPTEDACVALHQAMAGQSPSVDKFAQCVEWCLLNNCIDIVPLIQAVWPGFRGSIGFSWEDDVQATAARIAAIGGSGMACEIRLVFPGAMEDSVIGSLGRLSDRCSVCLAWNIDDDELPPPTAALAHRILNALPPGVRVLKLDAEAESNTRLSKEFVLGIFARSHLTRIEFEGDFAANDLPGSKQLSQAILASGVRSLDVRTSSMGVLRFANAVTQLLSMEVPVNAALVDLTLVCSEDDFLHDIPTMDLLHPRCGLVRLSLPSMALNRVRPEQWRQQLQDNHVLRQLHANGDPVPLPGVRLTLRNRVGQVQRIEQALRVLMGQWPFSLPAALQGIIRNDAWFYGVIDDPRDFTNLIGLNKATAGLVVAQQAPAARDPISREQPGTSRAFRRILEVAMWQPGQLGARRIVDALQDKPPITAYLLEATCDALAARIERWLSDWLARHPA